MSFYKMPWTLKTKTYSYDPRGLPETLTLPGGAHLSYSYYQDSRPALSKRPSQPFRFRSYEFRGVFIPKALKAKGKELFGVEHFERQGLGVRVTGFERTLVDVLDRPDLCGGWEEVWRSLESIEYIKLDQVVEYVRLLDKSTTAAKVGFYLEQHRDELMVERKYLDELRKMIPRQPHYLERSRRSSGRYIKGWNLVVPDEVIYRSWAEVT
jgi:hypothetical protein